MGRSIPYFQCHLCGTSYDPITLFARSTHQSLEAAAELLQSRPLAFTGTDITPFLEQAIRTQRWCMFFNRQRENYQDKVRGNRLITNPRSDTSTLLYDRCEIGAIELLADFPELRHRVSVGKGDRKSLIIQMDYNIAGAPGRVVIMTPQEAPLEIIHLDHQTPANHLYVATPPPMLRISWRDHLAIFNSDTVARPLWDWMTEWLAKAGYQVPVVAVTSMSGRPDKADIRRITILPVGVETAWTGTAVAAGLSRIGVCRIRGDAHRLSAKEVFYKLGSRAEWGGLPTVLGDFIAMSRRLLDEGQVSTFRSFLEETMSLDCLSTEEKRLATESLSQHITTDQRRVMDQVMDEVCDSPPLDLPDFSYMVSRGCYVRRKKVTGKESKITNFRAQIILRLSTTQVWKPGTRRVANGIASLLKITTESGTQAYCLVDESTLGNAQRLLEKIRDACAGKEGVIPTIYGREPLLGQVIEGTHSGSIEFCTFPCLGFSHETNSYNYPEVSFTSLGKESRQLGCGRIVSKVYENFMAGPDVESAGTAFRQFVESTCMSNRYRAGDERMMDSIAAATAVVCQFAFKASRSRGGFKVGVHSQNLLSLISRIGGLRIVDPQTMRSDHYSALPLHNIPVIMRGFVLDQYSPFRFHISTPSNFSRCNFDVEVNYETDFSEDEINSIPIGTFAMFAEAALRASTPEMVVRNALCKMPPQFINRVLHALSSSEVGGGSELEILLAFVASDEGAEFICEFPENPNHVFIRKSVTQHCFRSEHQMALRKRLDKALAEKLGNEFITKRTRVGDDRFRAWGVPRSLLAPNSNIIKLA